MAAITSSIWVWEEKPKGKSRDSLRKTLYSPPESGKDEGLRIPSRLDFD
jgi:hypothetical protein